MIKFDKTASMKISCDKNEAEIINIYISNYDLGIKDSSTHGNELELTFLNEDYKNKFFDTMNGIIKDELSRNINDWQKNEINSFSKVLKRAQIADEGKEIEKNINYLMGVLYDMRQNGVLEKNSPVIPHPPVKGIVLQGGGVRGLAYLGVLEEMEKEGALKEAEFACGSSAGAMIALLIATGLSAKQIKQYCIDFDNRNLLDARNSPLGEYYAGGITSIVNGVRQTMGAYGEPKTAREFIRNILLHLTGDADITFAELEEMRKINPSIKEFFCTATLLPEGVGAGETRLFSHKTSPDVVVADAALASMTLPGVWSTVNIRQKVYEQNNKFHFKVIGTYSDGGIHNNLPVDIANKFVMDNEYLMIPRNGKQSFVLDNPCVLSLSLCSAKQLNEAICPIPFKVKQIAIKNNQKNEHLFHIDKVKKAQEDLKEYQSLPIPSVINTIEKNNQIVSVHKEAKPSNVVRLFNIVKASLVEDPAEKNNLHNEGTILIYDNDISAVQLDLSTLKKNEFVEIGAKTAKMFFLEKRNPKKEYSHPELYTMNLGPLNNDGERHKILDALFMALVKEFEKYFQSGATSRGYTWNEMDQNIKIQHIYWKIYKIYNMLEAKPGDFDEFIAIKLNHIIFEKKQKEDLEIQMSDILYNKLTDTNVIKENLMDLIKEKPFDKKEFMTRFASLGAEMIVKLTNEHHSLLLDAAIMNPSAFDIMLTHIKESYSSLHQVPKIAAHWLGKPRMGYEDTIWAYKRLVNRSIKDKPLIFYCIDANRPESLQSLLQNNASRNILFQGKSIFQYAIENGKIECFLKACITKGDTTLTKQYHTKDFGKFITQGFKDKRNLAHSLFDIPDSATLNRSLQELMKPENEAIWNEFKKVLDQPDANGITPLELGLDKLNEEVLITLFNDQPCNHQSNASYREKFHKWMGRASHNT